MYMLRIIIAILAISCSLSCKPAFKIDKINNIHCTTQLSSSICNLLTNYIHHKPHAVTYTFTLMWPTSFKIGILLTSRGSWTTADLHLKKSTTGFINQAVKSLCFSCVHTGTIGTPTWNTYCRLGNFCAKQIRQFIFHHIKFSST